MVNTPSTMKLKRGDAAPPFRLTDAVGGEVVAVQDFAGTPAVVVMFICNHCPFVKHVVPELTRLTGEYGKRDVKFIAVNSNDVDAYPADAPTHMRELAEQQGWEFPFLFDEDQSVAKAYGAACTPDFFVFDRALKLAYCGQLDDSRPGNNVPVTGRDLRAALNALLAGKSVGAVQKPSMGCNIKWKRGNEPEYFAKPAGRDVFM